VTGPQAQPERDTDLQNAISVLCARGRRRAQYCTYARIVALRRMVGLPLLKIGIVLFKEAAKPIASRVKYQAQGEQRDRASRSQRL
jgi:hypothetical protein